MAKIFHAPLIKAGARDFAATGDYTYVAGDIKILKDGTDAGNIATTPTVVTGRAAWEFTVSGSLMEAQECEVLVVDSATKAIEDVMFRIITLPEGSVDTGKATAGAASTLTIGTGKTCVQGQVLEIHGGTDKGDARVVQSYNSGTGVVTVEPAWTTTPDNTSLWTLWPGPLAPDTTLPKVNTTQVGGTPQTARDLGASVLISAGTGTGQLSVAAGVIHAVADTVSDKTGFSLSTAGIDALYTRALVESYRANGASPTVAQAIMEILALETEKAIAGTTLTAKKLDHSTAAATYTLNDATTPTSITRAT